MKKIIFFITLILVITTLNVQYTFNSPFKLIHFFEDKPEIKLIKDWLSYRNFLYQQKIPKQEKLFTSNNLNHIQKAIVDNAPKIIQANLDNIHTLQQNHFQTTTFRTIQDLDIQILKIQNQLIQENIIDYYAEYGKTQTYLQAPALKLQAKSTYTLQQTEIENLRYLKVLMLKKDKHLKQINTDKLADWIDFILLEHQLNPQDPEWDAFKIINKNNQRTKADDLREITAYEHLQPRTPQFKKIQHLHIQLIQQNIELFSDFTTPSSAKEAVQNMQKINRIMKGQEFKTSISLYDEWIKLKNQADKEIILSLNQAFN